jgi:PadR family transcriptional regulator, regulatory protein PadR
MIDAAIRRGSAELAVLSVLAAEPLHGYELAQRIERQTGGLLRFTLASLYPLLYRLERQGSLSSEWRTAPSGRQRRYYKVTARGRKKLTPLRQQWLRYLQALRQLPGLRNA